MKNLILEKRGYFWWHDADIPIGQFVPDIKVSGILSIDENGHIELDLDANLPDSNAITFKPPNKSIQGILKDSGQYVLLLELYQNRISKYIAENCLISDFPLQLGKNDTVFNSLEIELKGFEEWISTSELTRIHLTNIYTKRKHIEYLAFEKKK